MGRSSKQRARRNRRKQLSGMKATPAHEQWRAQWEKDKQHIMLLPFALERDVLSPSSKVELPASWSHRPWFVGDLDVGNMFILPNNPWTSGSELIREPELCGVTPQDFVRAQQQATPEHYLRAHTMLMPLNALDDDQPLTWEVYGADGGPVECVGTVGEYRAMLERCPQDIYVYPDDEDDQPDAGDDD